ncbi:Uncharacterized membrane protein YgdD, TMEM256/DUF423 family [Hydrocarboniphaga daqingensis]|uniref:Uncharacterized membrane protein YgdD, TMEM256/DUF423 family n=1 Tax=Hydrocarboniphaga daqingensis TaxID=490188 RepID=A0A1M5RBR5_9GAMM|nr:DUF423 domain-containing protein [Hydrocarboniphaga daqingensis]SHH23794.1 Uncharacterized membrane protein YgdD, TMEM256/DUF423 family [Hydrocarboniphaga daqingensis]
MSRLWLSLAAVYGLTGVLLGAFGAHALRARLSPDLLAVWKTAVEYQFYHAFALALVGLLLRGAADRALDVSGLCFAAGVVVFSGSLYALALSNVRVLGAITPIGGLLFIAGWSVLLYALTRR